MRASQTVLPFKLTASDESLTAHAGLVLFDEYLGAMGIAGLINHELPGAGSAAGYDPSAHVTPLVLMLAGGGRELSPNLGDDNRLKAAYRGGCRACQNLPKGAIRHVERYHGHPVPSA